MRLFVTAALLGAASLISISLSACGGSGRIEPTGAIGFVSGRGGRVAIWTMNADGSGTNRLVEALQPAWSPQGHLAYVKKTDDGNLDLFSVIAGETRRLTTGPANDSAPSWSPDGERIAYVSDPDGNADIYVVPATGGEPLQLTQFVDVDKTPAWSPDGTQIAFVSRRDDNDEIYVMNADGSAQTRLTFAIDFDDNPVWSPDGRKIAFDSSRTQQNQIWVMNADGSGQEQLTFANFPSYGPVWSPDGALIAFNRTVGSLDEPGTANEDIWVLKPGSRTEKRITDDPATDTVRAWQPALGTP